MSPLVFYTRQELPNAYGLFYGWPPVDIIACGHLDSYLAKTVELHRGLLPDTVRHRGPFADIDDLKQHRDGLSHRHYRVNLAILSCLLRYVAQEDKLTPERAA